MYLVGYETVDSKCSKSCFFWFSSANKCLLKVGSYSAQLEQYPKAIEIFEQVFILSHMDHSSVSVRYTSHLS